MRKHVAKGYCSRHWLAFNRYGDPLQRDRRENGRGYLAPGGYHVMHDAARKRPIGVHILIAEKALGRHLPRGAIVHHVDEDKHNSAPSNLVICPSQQYHMLIHQRMRSMAACGRPDFIMCVICKGWDDPSNIVRHRHRACHAVAEQKRKQKCRDRLNSATT